MGLEVASFVGDLVSSNPLGTDAKSQGDDHIRLIKSVLQATFPLATGAYAFGTNLATFTSTTAGASDGPTIDLYRNKTSAVSDFIGAIQFNGLSSTGVKRQYAKISTEIRDNVNATEDAGWYVDIMVAGTSERTIGARFDFTGFGPNSQTAHFLGRNDNDGYLSLQGGNVAGGGEVRSYSSGHATQAKDIEMFSNGSQVYIWDFSAAQHIWQNAGHFAGIIRYQQNTTDSPGSGNNTQGAAISAGRGFFSGSSSVVTINTTAGSGTNINVAQGGGTVGSVSNNGTNTSYNTSSDKRKKKKWKQFDGGEIIDKLEVWEFIWKANNKRGFGVLAQDAEKVFPEAIYYDEETDFYGADYAKYVPLLIQVNQDLRRRVSALERKVH